MKRLLFGLCMTALVPIAVSQESKPADDRLHWMHPGGPAGTHTQTFTAISIVRDAPTVEWKPSVIHLKGNVEIKTSLTVAGSDKGNRTMYMFIHADAADYHEDNGAIDAHGDVHVTFDPH